MKLYRVVADYSNQAGAASSGPYQSRARAEDAAVAMTAKGHPNVRIYTEDSEEEPDE